MKWKTATLFLALVVLVLVPFTTLADKPTKVDSQGVEIEWAVSGCTKIQEGTLYGSDGSLLEMGYNEWGYNYQAHMFNGMWCDYHPSYRPGGSGHDWCMTNMADVELMMKWSDEWLANTDCDGDGLLDRHYGHVSYNGSGAWLTNHEKGTYVDDGGNTCQYEYFVKIVAAPVDAYVADGYWFNADDTEIGEVIWGAFAIIQEVSNDPCAGEHGLLYSSPDHPGLGNW
jgi:hypothetical protein